MPIDRVKNGVNESINLLSLIRSYMYVHRDTIMLLTTGLILLSLPPLQVMSDEFNVEGRSFKDGHDKMWTALDKSDDDYSASGGGSLHFYNSSAVTTVDGMLKIASYIEPTRWTRLDPVNKKNVAEKKDFKSGMVQSWNKMCFTGGIVEVDVIMPGDPFIGGLWPAIWILGNLGRSTYEVSTNKIWPWSYNTCDRKKQPAQELSACNRQNHYGMHPYQGRGATEIDIIEGMMGDSNGPLPDTNPNISLPYVDMTLQVSTGRQARAYIVPFRFMGERQCSLIWGRTQLNTQIYPF